MAKTMKKCRVCGKEYEACHTLKMNSDVFRWQEVACSPECGGIYLSRIRASRSNNTTDTDNNIADTTSDNTDSNEDVHMIDDSIETSIEETEYAEDIETYEV